MEEHGWPPEWDGMYVGVDELVELGLYYEHGTVAFPRIGFHIDTLVYLGKDREDYLFCPWSWYFDHEKMGGGSLREVRHRAERESLGRLVVIGVMSLEQLARHLRVPAELAKLTDAGLYPYLSPDDPEFDRQRPPR